jgi:hypothetical protein
MANVRLQLLYSHYVVGRAITDPDGATRNEAALKAWIEDWHVKGDDEQSLNDYLSVPFMDRRNLYSETDE